MMNLRKNGPVVAATTFTFLFVIVLMWAFLTPIDQLPSGPDISDYFWHIAIFAILVLPMSTTLPSQSLMIAAVAIVFGTLIEFVQPHFGRGFEVHDLFSNTLGVGIGWLIAKKLAGLKQREFK